MCKANICSPCMMARMFHARKRSVLDQSKKSRNRVKVEQGEVEVEGVVEVGSVMVGETSAAPLDSAWKGCSWTMSLKPAELGGPSYDERKAALKGELLASAFVVDAKEGEGGHDPNFQVGLPYMTEVEGHQHLSDAKLGGIVEDMTSHTKSRLALPVLVIYQGALQEACAKTVCLLFGITVQEACERIRKEVGL